MVSRRPAGRRAGGFSLLQAMAIVFLTVAGRLAVPNAGIKDWTREGLRDGGLHAERLGRGAVNTPQPRDVRGEGGQEVRLGSRRAPADQSGSQEGA